LTFSGCASLTMTKEWDWPWSKEEPYPEPVYMAVMWTPDVLIQPGKTPTRGFGGRLYFYNDRSKAIPVEGEIVVHGFDESVASVNDLQGEGVKRFRFTKEQLTQHYSQSDIGASYSVWIPWEAVEGPVRKLTLITTFRSANGRTLQGEPAKLMLPGKGAPTAFTSAPISTFGPGSMNAGPLAARGEGMRTTTIPVSQTLGQHLQRSNEVARVTMPNTPPPAAEPTLNSSPPQPSNPPSPPSNSLPRPLPRSRPLPGTR
jgi:hypothetical protein